MTKPKKSAPAAAPAPKKASKKKPSTMTVTSETGVTEVTEDFLEGPGPRIPDLHARPKKELGDQREPRVDRIPLGQCIAMAHPRNPKDHAIEAIIDSIVRFGFVDPPILDEATETMVAGHGRCEALEAMQKMKQKPPIGIRVAPNGEWLVPVLRGLSFANESERDAFVIANNQHVINGGWKFDILTELLGELRDGTDLGTSGLGFEQVELDNLLGNYRADSAPPDGFDPEDAPRDDEPRGDKPRTQITARIECPNCKHVFER